MLQNRPIPAGLGIAMLAATAFFIGATAKASGQGNERARAERVLQETGVQGGLIVHLGCGDGRLTAALGAGESCFVHGLDADAANVAKAREHISKLGSYGTVSVERWTNSRLPYVDDLVNLLVAEDLGTVSTTEVMRVLAPRGVAYVKRDGKWMKTVKPQSQEIDEWTHFLHDASNNAVSQDTQVGPPRRLKWACGPLWSRSHEFRSSLCAMVSANGRLFYIFDEGLTSITDAPIPERWTLTARDAFNGLLLWKRCLPKWGIDSWKSRALRSVPPTVQRLLVAEGDRVFVTLGFGGSVCALDAATGETLTTFNDTAGTEEIRCCEGVLLLRKGTKSLLAVEAAAGRKLWEAAGKIQRLSPAAANGRVFFQDGVQLICRRLADGKELWRLKCDSPASLLVVHKDRVLLSSRAGLQAVSVETGQSLWTADTRLRRQELFVANGRLWHWEGDRVVGRDLKTGKLTTRLNTDEVFTPGHHLRCYQTKCTESYLITPNRGVEFVSTTGKPHTQSDWMRGSCRYGVMPANGLLYVPPSPCFCYPGVKLTGFNALAAGRKAESRERKADVAPRLERGPAYAQVSNRRSPIDNRTAWPTYRHDARRSGGTDCEVPPNVSQRWQVTLQGRLTPPVVADGRVYVSAKDAHTLYALHVADGRELWRFTADGRIDSPPTVHGELVLFGGADGRVYCLRAADGELVWRFRAAPSEERIVAFDRLESPWRVHGSVLITGDVAYCTAGRSSYLDSGLWIYGLDPQTGEVKYQTQLDTWTRTREDARGKPFIPSYHMEGTLSDILVSQNDSIYLTQYKFDRELTRQDTPYVMPGSNERTVAMDISGTGFTVDDPDLKKGYEYIRGFHHYIEKAHPELAERYKKLYGGMNLGDRHAGLHLSATAGFLDDSWFNRTFWMYSASWPGWYHAHRGAKCGQLLVIGPKRTYAVQAFPTRNRQSPLFKPGDKGYLLIADANDNEPVLDDSTRGATKGLGYTRLKPPVWFDWVPIRIRAMVLAGKHLFVAGPPDVVDTDDPMASFEGRKGAVLRAVSADDGKTLSEQRLKTAPVFDGLIAAEGRLFLCGADGSLICFGKNK